MEKKITNRIGQLQDQFKEQTNKLLNNKNFDSEYFSIINRMKGINSEIEVLQKVHSEEFEIKSINMNNEKESAKLTSMKHHEIENKMDFVSKMQGDKISIRRAIDGFINYRTDLIQRYLKETYSLDVNLDSLKINTKTGQYGL